VPLARCEVHLLGELAAAHLEEGFVRRIEEAGGDLPEGGAHGVAVLADHADPLLRIQREDGDGAGVVQEVAHHGLPVAQVHGLAPHPELRALPDLAGRDHAADTRLIA